MYLLVLEGFSYMTPLNYKVEWKLGLLSELSFLRMQWGVSISIGLKLNVVNSNP